jgi:diguanylate cyclase (GGDEF)-like protein/PAS domain S-box-containing protein
MINLIPDSKELGMYHRILKVYIATQNSQLETFLQSVPPVNNSSHQFISHPEIKIADLKQYEIIILDFDTVPPESLEKIFLAKNDQAAVIGCFTPDNYSILTDNYHLFDQVWIQPFSKNKVCTSFGRIVKRFKEQQDSVLNLQYLDTLIDSLPDLIWFKDARGSHIKVNDSFCRAVNKTKAQVQGRGHYYIWDLEPDEYADGEYICLESEEIVLNKKKTCLFDETVKCGDELRKFKTYKSPIFNTDGKVIGTVGLARDVTDLKNLMIELNILIESLPFAVMVTDKNRIITSVNQKFIDNFKLDRTEILDKSVDSLIDETHTFTRSKEWILEQDQNNEILLSKDTVLKIHEEKLLDIFGNPAGFIYFYTDITFEHQHRNKLLIDANTDHLTRLNNRRSLHDFMLKTPCQTDTALLLADLDNFKEVNDQYGHDEGDKVLVAFADLLKKTFPIENLFRLGGDEFAIILHGMKKPDTPRQYAEQLLVDFNTKLARQFSHTNISMSIGIAMAIDGVKEFGELFKRADMALYESKKSGKNTSTFWTK